MNDKSKNAEVIKRIDNAIQTVKDKKSQLFFFVVDAKNTPNAKMEYIYQLAYELYTKKYNVCMLYQLDNEYTDKELSNLIRKEQPIDESRRFTGVGEWLGKEYMRIPHLNISKGTWKVSPSDFLFIPEVFAGLMKETFDKHIPCKRYVILQNFSHITEFVPFGDQWATYGIKDAIVPNRRQEELVKNTFKYVDTYLLPPYIPEYFRKPIKAKKFVVNVVTKTKHDAEHVIKIFYWKYPIFRFVPFRFLVDFPREKYAEMLQEGAITVWIDRDSSFGYNALESIRCGNIVIGKIPEDIPDWMTDTNGIWTHDINKIPDILASVVNDWLGDDINEEIYKGIDETAKKYRIDEFSKNVTNIMEDIFKKRIEEFKALKIIAENKDKNILEK